MYAPLRKLADDYKSRHVEVVMILESDEDKFQSAAALKRQFPWTVIQVPSAGSLSLDWGIRGYPTVFVIDAKGILRSWTVGLPCYDDDSGYDATEVAAELEKTLASKASQNNDVSKAQSDTDVAKPLYADLQGDWIVDSFYIDEDANSRELQSKVAPLSFYVPSEWRPTNSIFVTHLSSACHASSAQSRSSQTKEMTLESFE